MNPTKTKTISSNPITFEDILTRDDNWQQFKSLYGQGLRPVIVWEVEKMLKCRRMENGYATFICLDCGQTRKIAFSCKSKICSRCGKKHTDVWAGQVKDTLLSTPHRHIVLTVSDKLWPYFQDDSKLQKLLLNTAYKLIYKLFSEHNPLKKRIMPGLILILHPFGDDLKPNFHVHILVTEGGVIKKRAQNSYKWVKINDYIPYSIIRKRWQYEILTALRKARPDDLKLKAIINWCFTYRKNGFVIHAKRSIKAAKHAILKYIARYVRHPAISNRRIIGYDGEFVTFTYEEDRKTYQKRLPKFEFISNVIQHIPDRQFKVVRRCGLYSRRANVKYQAALELLGPNPEAHTPPFNWRRNVTNYIGADPLSCPECGCEMELYRITYPDGRTFKTVGGFDRLFKKGVLCDVEDTELYYVKDQEKAFNQTWRQLYLC